MDPEERFYSRNSVNINLFIVAGALLVLYQYRYGLGVINPVNDNWLMKHDWATHYLGWFFYRNEPWVFPIGNISNYLYPVGTNIGFTDSIPLAAIFFKVFSPILPHHFQYIGLWLFGCHLLLAFFTTKLFEQFSVKGLAQLFAALIVVLNPVLLYRSIHPALCSHWIIVGCLWVYFLDPAKYTPTRIIIYQGIFFIAGALINPYLSLIGAGFFVATAWRLWYFDKSVKFTKVLGLSALTFSIVAILWFVIGFFSFKTRTDLGVTGAYGLYAFNLNSLFNSSGWSAFFGQRPMVSWHQYESFMYLGVGMIALIIVVLLLSLWRRFHPGITSDEKKSQARINLTPLSVFVIFISLFAITHVVTFDDKVLLTVHLNSRVLKVFDIFRASARY
ncbi:MAG TPA: DUF6311 domain-containing protein, partial [Cyclobacteriaceae bacterium]|nr:DUF6311 domain-containing protein [Cyclobacteriaceae bacterium]